MIRKIESVTDESSKISLHRPQFGLFYVLVLGTSIALPSLTWACDSVLGNSPDVSLQRGGGQGNGQQNPAPQPPPNGNGGQGNNQPPAQAQPPKSGDDRPHHGPSRPGTRPRPPQSGGPATGPVRPGSGSVPHGPRPARPPMQNPPQYHPVPRPPVHHFPSHGHGRPHYAWGIGNGWRLHQFFLGDMRHINRMHRHYFYAGGYLPPILADRIQPVPNDLMLYLPLVPPGLEVGYYDGYRLLYDPYTLEVFSVIDLYRY